MTREFGSYCEVSTNCMEAINYQLKRRRNHHAHRGFVTSEMKRLVSRHWNRLSQHEFHSLGVLGVKLMLFPIRTTGRLAVADHIDRHFLTRLLQLHELDRQAEYLPVSQNPTAAYTSFPHIKPELTLSDGSVCEGRGSSHILIPSTSFPVSSIVYDGTRYSPSEKNRFVHTNQGAYGVILACFKTPYSNNYKSHVLLQIVETYPVTDYQSLFSNSPVNTPQTIVNTFEKFTNLLVRATSFEPVGQPLIVPVVDLRNTCILTKSLKNECEIVINCDYAYSHE